MTGYHSECNFFKKRGSNLETRAAHTHPNHSQVPSPPPPREVSTQCARSLIL